MSVEFAILSNFTFLTGASHPEEYVARAVDLGIEALAIADENSVAGIVRAHSAARDIARRVAERQAWDRENMPIGPPRPAHIPPVPSFPIYAVPRLIPAARLVFTDAPPVIALPMDRTGWGSLCRMLSTGRLRAEKGACHLQMSDLLEFADGLHLLLLPQAEPLPGGAGGWGPHMKALTRRFAGRFIWASLRRKCSTPLSR